MEAVAAKSKPDRYVILPAFLFSAQRSAEIPEAPDATAFPNYRVLRPGLAVAALFGFQPRAFYDVGKDSRQAMDAAAPAVRF